MRLINRIGQRYGRLVVVERARSPDGNAKWTCRCDCGRRLIAYGQDLQRGKVVSCGCAQTERRFKHGMARTPLYRVWVEMRSRCRNPKHPAWNNYGGRGIWVCDEWQDFATFARDVGPRPSAKHQLDRIDNNKGYFKANVRWATAKIQRNNQRNNRILEIEGVRRTFAEWADVSGIPWTTIRGRIERYGWDLKSAVTLPAQPGRPLRYRKDTL
jgi:hypothetical protein